MKLDNAVSTYFDVIILSYINSISANGKALSTDKIQTGLHIIMKGIFSNDLFRLWCSKHQNIQKD